MDAPIAIAIAIATGAGVGITLIVLLVRGSFMLGSMSNKVDNVDEKIGALDKKVDGLAGEIATLRSEVQQSNRVLAALANHAHDTDGRIIFTVPQ